MRTTARAGGYGPVIGDEGSGYAIARRGLSAVVREIDGRGPKTAIKERLFATEDVRSITDLLEHVYHSESGAADVAAYYPVVLAAAKDGDAEARRILEEAALELALDVVTVVRKLGLEAESFPVARSLNPSPRRRSRARSRPPAPSRRFVPGRRRSRPSRR